MLWTVMKIFTVKHCGLVIFGNISGSINYHKFTENKHLCRTLIVDIYETAGYFHVSFQQHDVNNLLETYLRSLLHFLFFTVLSRTLYPLATHSFTHDFFSHTLLQPTHMHSADEDFFFTILQKN